MKHWLREHDLTDDWVRWLMGAILVVGLFCPYLTTPPNAHAHADAPLKYGDRGQEVVKIQYMLISHGYVSLIGFDPNGYFGPLTVKAVRHWQRANGLTADGIVGTDTMNSLEAATPVPKSPPAKKVRTKTKSPVVTDQPAAPQVAPDGSWHDLAMAVGWTEDQWPVLSCIIHRESGGQANAKNKHSSATGLLQILASNFPGVNLYDPTTNLTIGLRLYQSRGWQPWTLPGHQCA